MRNRIAMLFAGACYLGMTGATSTSGAPPEAIEPPELSEPDDEEERQASDAAGCTCNDNNPCTTDTCANCQFGDCLSCVFTEVPTGTPCDDGVFCNGTDTCLPFGICFHPGNPCPGPDGDEDCSEGCNEAADNCTLPDPLGSPCNDGVFCNGADTCSAFGICLFHAGNPCPGPPGGCTAGSCNEAADNCTPTNGLPCGSSADTECSNPDTCSGGVCQANNEPDGTACDDLIFCNGADSCSEGICSVHAGNPCFIDTFESYRDTFELFAPGAWGDFNTFPATGTELRTSGGHPGKYVYHPGGQTMRHELSPPISTSAGLPIVWEFDFLVEKGGLSLSNRRITNGLRVEGTTTILEMGIHNSNLDPKSGGTVAGYAIRTVSIDGTPNNWVCFPGNPFVRLGWHHFRATIKPTQILFELDFEADGVFDTSRLVITNDTSSIAWNSLRIGGPSDVSSPNGGAGFDNVNIQVVPELCPADIAPAGSGDGVVNAADLALLLGAWGTNPGHPADLNNDGVVNASDLALLLGGWGACE